MKVTVFGLHFLPVKLVLLLGVIQINHALRFFPNGHLSHEVIIIGDPVGRTEGQPVGWVLRILQVHKSKFIYKGSSINYSIKSNNLSEMLILIWFWLSVGCQPSISELEQLRALKSQLEGQLHQTQSFLEKTEKSTVLLGSNLKDDKQVEAVKEKSLTAPVCTSKEGVMKVRETDQKARDVPITQAFLTNNRLSYFIDSKDESSIQGLRIFYLSLKVHCSSKIS